MPPRAASSSLSSEFLREPDSAPRQVGGEGRRDGVISSEGDSPGRRRTSAEVWK